MKYVKKIVKRIIRELTWRILVILHKILPFYFYRSKHLKFLKFGTDFSRACAHAQHWKFRLNPKLPDFNRTLVERDASPTKTHHRMGLGVRWNQCREKNNIEFLRFKGVDRCVTRGKAGVRVRRRRTMSRCRPSLHLTPPTNGF